MITHEQAEKMISDAMNRDRPNEPRETRLREAQLYALRGLMGEVALLRKAIETFVELPLAQSAFITELDIRREEDKKS